MASSIATPARPAQQQQLPHQTPTTDFALLEAEKENIQPVSTGRSAHALSTIFGSQPKQLQRQLKEQRDRFEAELEEQERRRNEGDEFADPLGVWANYISHTVETAPTVSTSLVPLLERCTTAYLNDSEYSKDKRYLKMWILYSRHIDKAQDVFAFLYSKDICTSWAVFYEEYAVILEGLGRRDKADEIYQIGINRRADPLAKLKRSYEAFQVRMLTPAPITAHQPPPPSNSSAPTPRSRTQLSLVSGSGAPLATPRTNGAASVKKGGMAVFVDATGSSSTGRPGNWEDLGTRDERRKENHMDGVEWRGETLPSSSSRPISTAPRTPKIEIFREEPASTPAPTHQPTYPWNSTPKTPKLAALTQKAVHVGGAIHYHQEMPWTVPSRETEPGKKEEKRMFNWDSVFPVGQNKEVSFDEIRAKKWMEKHRNFDFDVLWPQVVAPASTQTPRQTTIFVDRPQKNIPAPEIPIFKDVPLQSSSQLAPTPTQNLVFVDRPKPKTPKLEVFREDIPPTPAAPTPTPAVQEAAPLPIVVPAVVPAPAPTPAKHTVIDDSEPSPEKLVVKGKPSPTINTKAALADVMNMFGGVQEDDDDDDDDDFDDSDDDDDDDEDGQVFQQSSEPVIMMVPTKGFVPPTPTPASRTAAPTGRAAFETPMPEEKVMRRGGALADNILEEEEEEEREEEYGEEAILHEDRQRPVWQGRYVHGVTDLMTPVTERTMEFTTRTSLGGSLAWGTSSVGAGNASEMDNGFIAEEDEDEEEIEEGTTSSAMNTGKFGLPEGFTITDNSGQSTSFGEVVLIDQTSTMNTIDIRKVMKRSPTPETTAAQIESTSVTVPKPVTPVEPTPVHALAPPKPTSLATSPPSTTATFPNPCNPADPSIVNSIMVSLQPPLSSLPGFMDLRSEVSGKLDGLQKAAKKIVRRGSTGSAKSSSDRESPFGSLHLGEKTYEVKEKLGEGGFGAVFLATDPSSISDTSTVDASSDYGDESDEMVPKMVAIKIETPSSVWEAVMLDRIHTRITPSLRNSVVASQGLYAFEDESFLVLDYSNQGTLLDAVNKAAKIGIAPATQSSGGGMDELVAIFFAVELLKSIEGLHRANFIHGDLKIDNCMVRLEEDEDPSLWQAQYDASGAGGWSNKGIKMIDFGRSIDMGLYPEGQTFIADWPTDARDCVEMREARPWNFQTDYFGLASVLYCMLFGKYIETAVAPSSGVSSADKRYKIAQPLRRYWQSDIWNRLFDLLLNPRSARTDGSLPICDELQAIREEMGRYLEEKCQKDGKNLRSYLKKLQKEGSR